MWSNLWPTTKRPAANRARELTRQAEFEANPITRQAKMDEVANLLRALQSSPRLKWSRPDARIVDRLQSHYDQLEDKLQHFEQFYAQRELGSAQVEYRQSRYQQIEESINENVWRPVKRSAQELQRTFMDTANAFKKGAQSLELLPNIIKQGQQAGNPLGRTAMESEVMNLFGNF